MPLSLISIFQFITPDAFKNFFALIGTNGQGIGTSSFAEWVKDVSNSVVQETNPSLDDDINKMYDRLEESKILTRKLKNQVINNDF